MQSLAPLRVGRDALAILGRRRSNSSGGGAAAATGPRTPPGALSVSHPTAIPTRKVRASAAPGPRVAAPPRTRYDAHPPPLTSLLPPATLTLCGDRHSHISAAPGDDAAHAPVALYGNFAVVGPAAAVKMPDGSLLVTLPAGGGGHVAVPQAGDVRASVSSSAASATVLRLTAEALRQQTSSSPNGSHSGRCVLHGELMQLSGSYRVVDAPHSAAALPSWPAPDDGPSAAERAAVHRRCGGPRTHTAPLDVLTVAALPVGASLVLQAGARLSHPLCATPPCSSLDEEGEGADEARACTVEEVAASLAYL